MEWLGGAPKGGAVPVRGLCLARCVFIAAVLTDLGMPPAVWLVFIRKLLYNMALCGGDVSTRRLTADPFMID